MLVRDVVDVMRKVAPLELAEPWDKVGLLAGDSSREIVGPVVLTIDLTERVLEEAIASRAGLIVAYHPPIFEALSRVTDATPRQRVILRALESRIAIYSPHTALDAMAGGITDWLCEGLSAGEGRIAGDCRALTPASPQPATQQCKIVTFVPAAQADAVRHALASAGAGIIGAYQVCSFAAPGSGTFLGSPDTRPAIGRAGQLERVEELRLEMVCSKNGLALAIETMRRFHPYDEPAIDVYELVPQPRRGTGAGRRLVLDRPCTVRELAQRLKVFLGRDRVRYALAREDRPVSHVGVVPGAGSSLSKLAREEGCEVFVTGEMKHHEVLGALNAGMSVILGGHTPTERGYLPRLRARLEQEMAGVKFAIAASDVDLLQNV
jgi:dinuclear metal center YbgI/SA1388 family protein